MPSPLFGITVETARIGLDALAMRQAVAAQNIAQAGVPGARALQVSFAAQFDAAARASSRDAGWVQQLDGAVAGARVGTGSGPAPLDGQMVELNEVAVHYQALARAVRGEFSMLSLAVNGGRR